MDDVLPAAGTVLAMMSWRIDLLRRALAVADGAEPGCPGLAEAARAVRGLEVTGALAQRLLEEGYALRCAEERAEQEAREASGRPRGGLRAVR